MVDHDIREAVRRRYADSARQLGVIDEGQAACCGSDLDALTKDADGRSVFGQALYAEIESDAALQGSLGCGVPTEVADLHEGETVLDLGSGAGGDVILSARRVGPTGRVIGLDMTDEMVALARANVAASGLTNIEILQGYLEENPLPDATVDVVISNCVINLAADKAVVLAEAARVTRPGGRFAVSDVIADEGMDEATRADMQAFTGCIAGALTEQEFRQILHATGWSDVEIRYTHRVHPSAQAAIVRATRGQG